MLKKQNKSNETKRKDLHVSPMKRNEGKKKNKGKVSVYEITWSDLQETSFQARCIREQHVIQEWEAEWYTKTQEWEAVR